MSHDPIVCEYGPPSIEFSPLGELSESIRLLMTDEKKGRILQLLVVPAVEGLHGLLLRGRCGSRPPVVWRERNFDVDGHEDDPRYDQDDEDEDGLCWCQRPTGRWIWGEDEMGPAGVPEALVLIQEGTIAPEGCDRLARVLHVIRLHSGPRASYGFNNSVAGAKDLAKLAVKHLDCSIVVVRAETERWTERTP